jgi:hypothetical protein
LRGSSSATVMKESSCRRAGRLCFRVCSPCRSA